jgi:hypothetical protein
MGFLMTPELIVTALALLGSVIGVWVQLNKNIAIIETKLSYGDDKFAAIDKKFDEVMMHLRRIEDKLDNKADR